MPKRTGSNHGGLLSQSNIRRVRHATNSQRITVVGRRAAPSTRDEELMPALRPADLSALRHSKLKEVQRKDTKSHARLLNARLTNAQQVDLENLQNEISGLQASNETPDPVLLYGGIEIPMDLEDGDAEGGWEYVDDEDELAVTNDLIGPPQANSEWSSRLATEYAAWMEQLPRLCDALLSFRSRGPIVTGEPKDDVLTVRCIDLFAQSQRSFEHPSSESWANVTLLRHGYLSPSPTNPKAAVSIELLDVLAAVLRRGPSVSVQIMAKAFSDLQNVPYKRYFRTHLTSVLDAYYYIHRCIQNRVNKVLGRDALDWRLRNECTACTYKLEGEPEMRYEMEVTVDGCDSNKRCATAGSADPRVYESEFYISRSEVDEFKNEVSDSRKSRKSKEAENNDDNGPSECEKRWKNAKSDNQPDKTGRARSHFEETGIFISACRHSFVLTVCDMVRSGELAKYPLATISKLITALDKSILMGYDIGCTMLNTAKRSARVGPLVKESGFDMVVGSFHGPAHNRACQLGNHSHNRIGAGLSYFENCEIIFSSSNRTAGTTRLASRYHRLRRIDIHYDQWNDDQYANLGHFLRNRYIMALKTIDSTGKAIAGLNSELSTSDLNKFFQDECAYLNSLTTEFPGDEFAIEYLTCLEQLELKSNEFHQYHQVVENQTGISDLRGSTRNTSKMETRRRNTVEQLIVLQKAVQKLEEDNGVSIRWTRGCSDWDKAEKIRKERNYQLCLDELERLVVLRILELSRTGLSGTGYKMRSHIQKSIISRSQAITKSLERFNQAAKEIDRATITWKEIKETKILADFDLLRHSRREVLKMAWAKPENRKCVEQWHQQLRAQEEIQRLNIEVRRVQTAIIDEGKDLQTALDKVSKTKPTLYWAVHRHIERRLKLNAIISGELDLIKQLPGFSGWSTPGVRIGRVGGLDMSNASGSPIPVDMDQPPALPISNHMATGSDLSDAEDLEHDDEVIETFEQWQSQLASVDT